MLCVMPAARHGMPGRGWRPRVSHRRGCTPAAGKLLLCHMPAGSQDGCPALPAPARCLGCQDAATVCCAMLGPQAVGCSNLLPCRPLPLLVCQLPAVPLLRQQASRSCAPGMQQLAHVACTSATNPQHSIHYQYIDTPSITHHEHQLGLGLNIEAALGLGLALQPDAVQLLRARGAEVGCRLRVLLSSNSAWRRSMAGWGTGCSHAGPWLGASSRGLPWLRAGIGRPAGGARLHGLQRRLLNASPPCCVADGACSAAICWGLPRCSCRGGRGPGAPHAADPMRACRSLPARAMQGRCHAPPVISSC